jgi:hypothetical protein
VERSDTGQFRRLIDGFRRRLNPSYALHIAEGAALAGSGPAIELSQLDPGKVALVRQPHIDAHQAAFAEP